MVVTKKILIEEIRRILSGGNPSSRDRVKDAEIALAITDAANVLLKAEATSTMAVQGQPNIDGLAIVLYEGIPLERGVNWDKTRTAQVALPVRPMMLKDGQSVQAVYPTGLPHLGYFYIPEGIFRSWMSSRYVAPLHKRFYTYSGNKIIIYDDLFSSGESPSVDIKLVVADINSVGDNDPLPILPEHRAAIIKSVIDMYSVEPDTNRRETDQLSPSKRN